MMHLATAPTITGAVADAVEIRSVLEYTFLLLPITILFYSPSNLSIGYTVGIRAEILLKECAGAGPARPSEHSCVLPTS